MSNIQELILNNKDWIPAQAGFRDFCRNNPALGLYEPSYADLTCEEVLDRIESEFSQSDYDLAILCFEAISYIATHYPEVI